MTIAVLPFANLSGDPDQEYLSDGFTEELIAELGMIEPDRLSVIGRTTTNLYKGAKKSIGEIGRELGVMYLLEGSVRRAGPRVRVTAQLVDTRSMTNLWSETYERAVGDVLAVQTDVSRQIATSLTLALAPARGTGAAPSFAAYELYMRGRYFREQASEDSARKAIEYYERALAIDPEYAAAYAGIADAYRLLGAPGWEVDRPLDLLVKAKAAAERALAIDPRLPEARAVLAMIRFNFDWDLAGAEREIQEALRLNPSFAQAHQYYSSLLTTQGRPDEAIAAARRAVELDPLAPTATTSLGVRYYYGQRCDEAVKQFQKTLEVTPGFAVAHWGLAQCYRGQRRYDDQIDELLSAVQLSGNSSYMRAHLAYGYAVKGDRMRAEAIAQEIAGESGRRYVAPYHLALIAAGLGNTADSVRWLERAFEDRSGWMMFLPVEPEFDAMRRDPAFQRLLARVRPQT
jgi:TolB-like protein/Tfp pilus assembly protein PilF